MTSAEVDPAVADHARRKLREVGCKVTVMTGDGALGFPPGAPFDRVTAARVMRWKRPSSGGTRWTVPPQTGGA
ncbi:hypothetical protein [Actinomadura citrea]|uniref:Protein-L-isoaspartate O-methyltransferase n=1 Tax=Actinomadura citrea TaxID=46158 RepID=A0A7Y9GHK4_9ACTN|nr:hypothetical protein [Actinomadura citrea]NYE16609.1 protein-L-isoaspartate O-methyltransferase [Actinomadura citrea]GGT56831.1 hypothetical protein GCM10010177_11170 [Actinomadura citrea]